MDNGTDILTLGAVLIIIQKPVIGSHSHIGKDGPVTAKMFVVHKIDPVIVQECTCCQVEVQFATDTEIKEMLHTCFHQIKFRNHGIVEHPRKGFCISEIDQWCGFINRILPPVSDKIFHSRPPFNIVGPY